MNHMIISAILQPSPTSNENEKYRKWAIWFDGGCDFGFLTHRSSWRLRGNPRSRRPRTRSPTPPSVAPAQPRRRPEMGLADLERKGTVTSDPAGEPMVRSKGYAAQTLNDLK